MKLIVITLPTFFNTEATIINALFNEGLDILHLRKPNAKSESCKHLLNDIDKQWHNRIVLHDNFPLLSQYNLKGIHLNRRNPYIPQAYEGHISRSCHSLSEVNTYKSKCNYVFLSPLFDSISKQGYQSNFSEQDIINASQNGIIDNNIIALGGIDLDTIPKIKKYNFGGVAVMGGLWKLLDINEQTNYSKVVNYFKKLRTTTD